MCLGYSRLVLCVWSKWGCAVNVNYTLDFKDFVCVLGVCDSYITIYINLNISCVDYMLNHILTFTINFTCFYF